jgi:hypothetical protein
MLGVNAPNASLQLPWRQLIALDRRVLASELQRMEGKNVKARPGIQAAMLADGPMGAGAAFEREVSGCFGVMPNFFCSASEAPGLIEELWGFAKSAYQENRAQKPIGAAPWTAPIFGEPPAASTKRSGLRQQCHDRAVDDKSGRAEFRPAGAGDQAFAEVQSTPLVTSDGTLIGMLFSRRFSSTTKG